MRQVRTAFVALGASILVALAACQDATTAPVIPVDPATPPSVPSAEQTRRDEAARLAWTFVVTNSDSVTGLAKAVSTFQPVTVWDIASLIGAVYSAHDLGLVGDSAYDVRIHRILATLRTVPLFQGAVFNKFYEANTARMTDRAFNTSSTGFGWSATDVGRLLVWMRILSVNQPRFASEAQAVVARVDVSRIVKNGTLEAVDIDPATNRPREYVEAGLGYLQYAAAGYAVWGHPASRALDASADAHLVSVLGVPVSVDDREWPRLTSEPYLMMGLETGWYSFDIRTQALAVLAAQKARYDATGIITLVTEDHLPDAPYYFYFYSLYHNGQSFVVEGPDDGQYVTEPRWLSTKAAFAWNALVPNAYTQLALDAVQRSAIPNVGWGSGIYEKNGAPTGEANLNTAGIVLESLLFQKRGKPLLTEVVH